MVGMTTGTGLSFTDKDGFNVTLTKRPKMHHVPHLANTILEARRGFDNGEALIVVYIADDKSSFDGVVDSVWFGDPVTQSLA